MAFIALAFLGSTVGMLFATAWETVRRHLPRQAGRDADRCARHAGSGVGTGTGTGTGIIRFDPPTEGGRA